MIAVSKECGAGLVKFQLFDAEDDKGKPHYDYVKAHELTFEQAKELFDYGAEIGIEVFFSVFGAQYVEWCEKIGVKRYKIACQMRDARILSAVFQTRKPVYISTNEREERILDIPGIKFPTKRCYSPQGAKWYNKPLITVHWLYCSPKYPAAYSDYKLVTKVFDSVFTTPLDGLSDHTLGIDIAKIAIANGAKCIEKHFTLDRSIPSPDAPWSMEPDELKELVRWDKVCQEIL